MKQHQILDREARAAWRNIRIAELQAEEKKRADEIHMAKIQAEVKEKKRADEIKIQIARIEADKDLTLKDMEF